LVGDLWEKFYKSKSKWYIKFTVELIMTILYSLRCCITDFDFVYYGLYMGFVIIGLTIHPFFFAFHLSDFIRSGTLKIVVNAIVIPRVQLGLTFMIFMLVE
jgi:hypothetical protein